MKLIFSVFITLTLFSTAAYCQRDPNKHREQVERVNAARIGFVTERLKLSVDQAEKFWPVYNEYSSKRQELFFETKKKIRQGKAEGISDVEKSKLIDETMALKDKELDLQKLYKERLLKILSVNQYLELLNAERDFNKMLMEKLRERRDN